MDSLGARCVGEDIQVRVWAPFASEVRAQIEPARAVLALARDGDGVFEGRWKRSEGTHYRLSVDGGAWRPDPVSRSLPDGVHGCTEVPAELEAPAPWAGRSADELVFYELHVGTFTPAGTFDAAIAELPYLAELGVTAVELMPLAEVPGPSPRNWGYDGVQLFSVRRDYGGREGLRRFVDAAHDCGLAVIEDVVYNHLGPEGNYLHGFGPYFTRTYHTPWGEALNMDGPHSDGVRAYFLQQARERFVALGLDGLRLDSCPNIYDRSAYPFLEELAAMTDGLSSELGRPLHLIAEADDNDPRWVRPRSEHGLGLHGVWMDDLHHAVHALLSGERAGFYLDFGSVEAAARAFVDGAHLRGQRSHYRLCRWGRAELVPPARQVVYFQNHDLVGNRGDGARAATLYAEPGHQLGLALGLLAPGRPLLFMGQEYGETRPFWFFSSFEDPQLARSVRRGRPEVFRSFGGQDRAPDPQDPATKAASVLELNQRESPRGRALLRLHRDALRLRRDLGAPRETRVEAGAFEVRYDRHVVQVSFQASVVEGPVVFDSWAYLGPGARPEGPRLVLRDA